MSLTGLKYSKWFNTIAKLISTTDIDLSSDQNVPWKTLGNSAAVGNKRESGGNQWKQDIIGKPS